MRSIFSLAFGLATLVACGGPLSNQECDRTYGGLIYDLSLNVVATTGSEMTLIAQVLADEYYVPAAGAQCGIPQLVGRTDLSAQKYPLSVTSRGTNRETVASGTPFTIARALSESTELVVTCANASDSPCNHGHPHEFEPQTTRYCLRAGSTALEEKQEYVSCPN